MYIHDIEEAGRLPLPRDFYWKYRCAEFDTGYFWT